jgi:hypothetical protein
MWPVDTICRIANDRVRLITITGGRFVFLRHGVTK